jgi:tetratricopeptide (TPR) repeat protein
LNPEFTGAQVNLIITYTALNRPRDAKASYDRLIARLPNHTWAHIPRYGVAFLENDVDEMRRQAAATKGAFGDEDQQESILSDTATYAGHLRQARELSQNAAAMAERNDQQEAAAKYLANAALHEVEVGNSSRVRQLTTRALGLNSSRDVHILTALALARSGDSARATVLADDLDRRLPRNTVLHGYWLPTIRASTALWRNDAPGAIDFLRATSNYELAAPTPAMNVGGTLYPVYVRGEAYLKLRRPREAAAEFQKIIDHRGIVLNFVTGALAHLQLGRALAMSGDAEGARKAYDDFFALWKDADHDIPVLKAARTEYTRLP